ncbi:unnamed protein product [Heligmosomoides polygyrus]|uniref:Uncharacterized protein n=1 Tax=Heligmosomoides polygyrus TaxID=6339 RepID=A0A183GD71_HELPZ|nr:unnamed protein product [Heligmosomoides polygyrus]
MKLGERVPHDLTSSLRKKRVDAEKESLDRHKQEPFLHQLVTLDEKRISLDDHQCSKKWLREKQKPQPTPKHDPHQKKVMLSVWWYREGVIFWRLIESSSSIDAEV